MRCWSQWRLATSTEHIVNIIYCTLVEQGECGVGLKPPTSRKHLYCAYGCKAVADHCYIILRKIFCVYVSFQADGHGVTRSVSVDVRWYLAVGWHCPVIPTVHWVYKQSIRPGSNNPAMSSSRPVNDWCLKERWTIVLACIPECSSSNTSGTVWLEATSSMSHNFSQCFVYTTFTEFWPHRIYTVVQINTTLHLNGIKQRYF